MCGADACRCLAAGLCLPTAGMAVLNLVDASLLALPLLALADSTSIGTLVIPVLLLLAPGRPSLGRMLAYLAIVAGLYFAIGVALLGVTDAAAAALQSPHAFTTGLILEALLGLALIIFAVRRSRRPKQSASSKVSSWRKRALEPGAPLRPLFTLAVSAVAIEAASMLPYIGAIVLISRADFSVAESALVVAGYCILMILPALILTVLRRAGSARLDPVLERITRWSSKSAGSPVILWSAGLVGAALIIDAVVRA